MIPAPTLPEGFGEVVLDASRYADVLDLDTWAFPSSHEVAELLEWSSPLSWDRVRGIEADGRLVAMHASYPFGRFPTPGGVLPAAGLTWVGVHPQYRRRGLLRSMITRHLADCLTRGEPLSVLTASEPAIYGRFGYGLASSVVALSVARGAGLRPVAGSEEVAVSLMLFDPVVHEPLVEDLHARAGAGHPNRPGWVLRESPELRRYFYEDPPAERDGFESLRLMLASRDGEPCGYAVLRRKLDWTDGRAAGVANVRELAALDAATTHALWTRLLDLDLVTTTRAWNLACDDPLLSLLVDLRSTAPRLGDNIWVRIVDLPAALRGRRYAAGVDVVLEVADDLLPANAGRWRLVAEAFSDRVSVQRTDDQPQIALDSRELGSLYLGGSSASALARAGLLQGDPTAIARTSAAFGWPIAPASSWIF